MQHRVLLIYQHPALASLDGVAVSAVERQAAEVVFGVEQQVTRIVYVQWTITKFILNFRIVKFLPMFQFCLDYLVQHP